MLNFLFNFSLMVFICYSVSWSAKAILFGNKRRKGYAAKGSQSRSARSVQRKQARKTAVPKKKKAQIIRLRQNEKTARENLRAA
jgi:hypothetical protein